MSAAAPGRIATAPVAHCRQGRYIPAMAASSGEKQCALKS
jgi:hypothetical protein